MNNLHYVDKNTKDYANSIIDGYGVHKLTVDVINQGLERDCVDAVKDVKLALQVLQAVCDNIQRSK